MSYQQIGRLLNISPQSVHECHQRAIAYMAQEEAKVPAGMDRDDFRRLEEASYIDGVLERYMRIFDKWEDKKPRTAIEALNGAHRYLETLIKLQGIGAPTKVEHTISVEALRRQLEIVEGELAVIDEQKQITSGNS